MFDKFWRLFKRDNQNEMDDMYVVVPESEISEKLKSKIIELEKLGEKWSGILQKKYATKFESQGKQNLRVWVCRDIDGDEKEGLTSEECLEKEYRSQIAIDFDDITIEDDEYADYIQLWYYFGGYPKHSGTLYNMSKNNLETDIEEALKTLIK